MLTRELKVLEVRDVIGCACSLAAHMRPRLIDRGPLPFSTVDTTR